jgi:hypothetical protein
MLCLDGNKNVGQKRIYNNSSLKLYINSTLHFQVDVLSLLIFKVTQDCAIRKVQENQEGLKLNGTHQFLVYVGSVDLLDDSTHTVKENKEVVLVVVKKDWSRNQC